VPGCILTCPLKAAVQQPPVHHPLLHQPKCNHTSSNCTSKHKHTSVQGVTANTWCTHSHTQLLCNLLQAGHTAELIAHPYTHHHVPVPSSTPNGCCKRTVAISAIPARGTAAEG
jgi:hypothetical protein